MLKERKARILAAIVADYILLAEPVGSRTISKKYDLGVSSATIRNEMADLEEMGYILQPHTSAGRIPSDKGYRYYVDYLMERHNESFDQERELYRYVLKKQGIDDQGIQDILEQLAEETGLLTFMLVPEAKQESPILSFLHIHFIKPGRALMVVLTGNEKTENKIIEIPDYMGSQELDAISKLLNRYLKGLSVEHWNSSLIEFIVMQTGMAGPFMLKLLETLNDVLNLRKKERIYVAGRFNLLDQPEFQDVSKIKPLFKDLEETHLKRWVKESENERLNVIIGTELGVAGMEKCSVLIGNYTAGPRTGYIGFFGPKRMDYAKSTSLLEIVALALERIYGKELSDLSAENALSLRNPRTADLVLKMADNDAFFDYFKKRRD